MRKKKDDTVVRTTVIEAIIVILVCLVAFLGLVYIKLMPYIGESIAEKQEETQTRPEKDLFSDDVEVIRLDEDGNVIVDYENTVGDSIADENTEENIPET